MVEAEPYLLEFVRYLHVNPLRAGVVPDLRALARYPWTGHSALLGPVPRPWQATGEVLGQFAREPAEPTAPSWQPGSRTSGAPISKAGGWCAAWAGGPP